MDLTKHPKYWTDCDAKLVNFGQKHGRALRGHKAGKELVSFIDSVNSGTLQLKHPEIQKLLQECRAILYLAGTKIVVLQKNI